MGCCHFQDKRQGKSRGPVDSGSWACRSVPTRCAGGSLDRAVPAERGADPFPIELATPQEALKFLQKPGLLTYEILKQEKAYRGWHLTEDAPDYVRQLRSQRSRDPADMNCVEWIVHALELGGLSIPMDVLTPTELLNWCEDRGRSPI